MLTGNYYFKPTMFGLVLFVEKEFEFVNDSKGIDKHKEFIKASIEDIFTLNLVANPKNVKSDVEQKDIPIHKDMS